MLPEIHTWSEWGRVFTDAVLWAPAVREVCRQNHLPVTEIEAGYPGTNAVFIVDRRYVVKLFCPFCREDFALETELYPLLALDPRIPSPRLLGQGTLHDRIEWPYIVMSFIPGSPIRELRNRIPPENLLEIARHLGEIVRAIHALPLTTLRALDTSRAGWIGFLGSQQASLRERCREKTTLPEPCIDELVALVSRTLAHEAERPLVLVNGDLTEDHLLLVEEEERWRISGLIDFADAMVGAADYEWPALWGSGLNGDPDCLRAFMSAYAPDQALSPEFVDRLLAYTCIHEFGPEIINDMLRRWDTPPPPSLEALRALFWNG